MPDRPSGTDILFYIIAIFLPPVPVYFKVFLGADFWINIILTFFAWIPGVLHAWYVIYAGKGVAGRGPDPVELYRRRRM